MTESTCPDMVEQSLFLASFALGIGPALFLLWHGLRRFDYPRVEKTLFDDRRVFFSLAVGLVFGTLSSLFALTLRRPDPMSAVIAVAGVAILEEAFKLVYLNRKGYRGNFSTTFYGFSLGLGVAATVSLAQGIGNPNLISSPLTFVLLLLFTIGLCTMEGSTGALIGYGCSKGLPFTYFLRALVARAIYTVAAGAFLLSVGEDWLIYLSLFVSLGVGLMLYYFTYVITMPDTLPVNLKRRVRKERKARSRAARRP